MIDTSDFSAFVIQRSEELQTEIFSGLKNVARNVALSAWATANLAGTMPPQANLNLPTSAAQQHNDAAEELERRKKQKNRAPKSNLDKKSVGGGEGDQLNLPSLAIR